MIFRNNFLGLLLVASVAFAASFIVTESSQNTQADVFSAYSSTTSMGANSTSTPQGVMPKHDVLSVTVGTTSPALVLANTSYPLNLVNLIVTNNSSSTIVFSMAGLFFSSGDNRDFSSMNVFIPSSSPQMIPMSFPYQGRESTSDLRTFSLSPYASASVMVQGTLSAYARGGMTIIPSLINLRGTLVNGASTTVNIFTPISSFGFRAFKSKPIISQVSTLSGRGVSDGTLFNFSIMADATGPVSIAKLKFQVGTQNASTSNFNVYGYTDAQFTQPIPGVSSDGRLMFKNTNVLGEVIPQNAAGRVSPVIIPASQTYYFTVRASVGPVAGATNYTVSTTLKGDSTFMPASTPLATAAVLQAQYQANIIWSPNTKGMARTSSTDWVNGFGLITSPSGDYTQVRTN